MRRRGIRVLGFLLGALFVWAGAVKLREPLVFARQVVAYELLPWEWTNLVALILPCLEVLSGSCLMAGLWVRAGALLIAAQLLVYCGAIAWALAQGLAITCGCLGFDQEVSGWSLATNLLLLTAAVVAAVWQPQELQAGSTGANSTEAEPRP